MNRDADFDLDVRLQELPHRISANNAPTGVSCNTLDCSAMGCPSSPSACRQRSWQD